jgi:hypothetical protein
VGFKAYQIKGLFNPSVGSNNNVIPNVSIKINVLNTSLLSLNLVYKLEIIMDDSDKDNTTNNLKIIIEYGFPVKYTKEVIINDKYR